MGGQSQSNKTTMPDLGLPKMVGFPFPIPPYRNLLPPASSRPLRFIRKFFGSMALPIGFVFGLLWRWPVVSIGAVIVYSYGINAMYGNDFIVAVICYALAVIWLTAKVLTWETISQHRSHGWISSIVLLIAVVVLGGSLHMVKREYNRVPRPVSSPLVAGGGTNQGSISPKITSQSETEPLLRTQPSQGHAATPSTRLHLLPRAPTVPNAIPNPISPRIGTGPDAYKDISDAELAQWGIDEADNIEKMVDSYTDRFRTIRNPDVLVRSFSNDFRDCCAQGLKDLRTEILGRLGPPGDDAQEKKNWKYLFEGDELIKKFGWPTMESLSPQLTYISPVEVKSYAPYLRQLAIKLKRCASPLAPPKELHFLVQQVPSGDSKLPLHTVATIQPESTISKGYILIEFTGEWGSMGSDLNDSSTLFTESEVERTDNIPFARYVTALRGRSFYAVKIGILPITHESPLHFIVRSAKPVTVTKVTWFDD